MELLLLFSRKEKIVGFVPGCLACPTENDSRTDDLLSSPFPQTFIQAYKTAITIRVLLEKSEHFQKNSRNNEIFKQYKRENNFMKRQQKMVGNYSQIRNQISLTHTK